MLRHFVNKTQFIRTRSVQSQQCVLPGLGVPGDDGHHVERADDWPPEDPHVGAVADGQETFVSDLRSEERHEDFS